MSWGQGASGAAEAGSSAGNGANLMSQLSEVGKDSQSAQPSGFSSGINTPTQGPTVQAGNMQTYGTENPSMMQQGVNLYERFGKGQGQSVGDAYKNFGNNPETYGAAYGLINKMASTGKQGGAAPITINSTYQQPVNEYLKKYGRA